MVLTSQSHGSSLVCAGCIAWVLSCATPSLANDSAFGGEGADLVPMKENRVRMVSEDITLTAHFTKPLWNVKADYVFENLGTEPVTIQVGFPELRCDSSDGTGPVEEPCQDRAFKNLKTLVNGKPVKHRVGTLADGHEWRGYLGVIWLFDVTFPAKRRVRIQHSYTKGSSTRVGYDRLINYITLTGVSWAGSIGRARFTARLPPFVMRMGYGFSEGLVTHAPRVSAGGTIELVAEGTDWMPTGDVGFWFNELPGFAVATPDNPDPRLRCELEAFQPGAERIVQDCINVIYASKGYPFRSPALRKKYYSGSREFRKDEHEEWTRDMVPQRGFSQSWFTDEEVGLLRKLERRLQQRAANESVPVAAEALPGPASGGSATGPGDPGPATATSSSGGAETAPDSPVEIAEARGPSPAGPPVAMSSRPTAAPLGRRTVVCVGLPELRSPVRHGLSH